MMMILQLLVAAVAVGLTVAAPEYKQNVAALGDAINILKTNVLSMEGNIPLLNDSRRHYAEIVHVIHYHLVSNDSGVFEDEYQNRVNNTAPEAIQNPETVIDEVNNLINTVAKETAELRDLIDACVQEDYDCNELIDDTVQDNLDQYGHQADVLFAAGDVANELKIRNSKFEEVSRNLQAHPYVISTPQDLEDIAAAVSNLLVVIYEN